MTIAEALKLHRTLVGSDSAVLDAQVLLAHCLGCSRSWLYAWPEKTLEAEVLARYRALMSQRAEGVPIAHLLGSKEFWSLSLAVNGHTLIPRPETETLVATALELSSFPGDGMRILDLGTGTGAIALALAKERPGAQVLAVDNVAEAVALAQCNSETLGLTRVCVQLSDWFAQVEGCFDLIVANPPYIDATDPHLAEGDVRYEPASALVAEQGGLSDLSTIVAQAGEYLAPAGWLLLEHGWQQARAVRQRLIEAGFTQVQSWPDLAGVARVSGGSWAGG